MASLKFELTMSDEELENIQYVKIDIKKDKKKMKNDSFKSASKEIIKKKSVGATFVSSEENGVDDGMLED